MAMSSRVDFLVLDHQEIERGVDQENAEHVNERCEFLEQPNPGDDEDGAQHDGTDDAPEQHLGPVSFRASEIIEDNQEDKQVVDAQRFLQHVAGKEFIAWRGLVNKETEAEQARKRNPEKLAIRAIMTRK